ncbi:hypothetical protein PV10_05455 [Exophiala mesophila]|uniref:Cupin type-2 domain-containing protein n=1 Tax=Exophiala mesophila TaxID=212818 RepID=A0A0D1Z7S8_EXOME|nr:uncharacterized protein PV10_05455 [Exophiala mesophila]KIV90847.1 hypothetical protein PV10_05455 [Exophiala mesophila]
MAFFPRGKIAVGVVNAEGKSVFEDDLVAEIQNLPGDATIRRVFKVDKVPVPNIHYVGAHALDGIANEAGLEWVECEMPAGAKSPMHTTPSIDFGTIITGEVTLILDSGEEKTLKPGDLYVLKAAAHAWENRTSQSLRFSSILAASRPGAV